MTVLEKRMGAEGWHYGRHFNNVSDGARTGNCNQASRAIRRSFLAQAIVNIGPRESVLIYDCECADEDMAAAGRMHLQAGVTGVLSLERAEASDEALVLSAQDGDRNAFGALYQRYSRMVHGILLARVPRQVVEDLLQDVFLHALPRLGSLRDATRFGGWLAAMARNRANDHHRLRRPMEELSEGDGAGDRNQSRRADVSDGLFLLDAVRSLPEAYRETLILRFVEGMTGPEIAEKTGLRHGSVRVNLYRGMQMLREKLQKT